MSDAKTAPAKPGGVQRWARRVAIVLGLLVVIGIALLGAAEHHTSQADFCGSCHIMEPYYASWKGDLHGSKSVHWV